MSDVAKVETPVEKLWRAGGYYTSLDRNKDENRMVIYRCMENCSSKVSDLINEEIYVANIFAHKVELPVEETGEVREVTRTVLITPEGVTIECVSDGISRCVKALMIAFGDPPWTPAKHVKIVQENVGNNRRTFKLKLMEVAQNGGPKKPGKEPGAK